MSDIKNNDELIEFRAQLDGELSQIQADNNEAPSQAFQEYVLDKLSFQLVDAVPFQFDKVGPKKRHIGMDGYAFDDSDSSLILFSFDYAAKNDMSKMDTETVQSILKKMIGFVLACVDHSIEDYCDNVDEVLKIAATIRSRLSDERKYESDYVQKIKFFIITNREFSSYVTHLKEPDLLDKDTSVEFWGIERFYTLAKSGKEREEVRIDFKKDYGREKGLQCLNANVSGKQQYSSYLCIIPGIVLARIYSDNGSNLLEENVRAFLGEKNKYNKSIIKTISDQPDRFFIYNNGIAVTGKNIEFETDDKGQTFITGISDMQIINGGQTTASIYSAFRKNEIGLNQVYIPRKLTCIKDDEQYEDIVGKIARYSNSQSKISDADFFSVDPFHKVMETLSKETPAPAKSGQTRDTYWFYERARGKYNQLKFKMTAGEKKQIEKQYPRSQVIKKEELAKYYRTCIEKKPYIAGLGNVKCMNKFAPIINKVYNEDNSHSKINTEFFRRMVALAIIFRETDKLIQHSDWYRRGNGIKNPVLLFTIGKLCMDSNNNEHSIDYKRIWTSQTLYPSLAKAIQVISQMSNDFFARNAEKAQPTELVKKQEAWEEFAKTKVSYDNDYIDDLISTTVLNDAEKEEIDILKQSTSTSHQIEIFNLGQEYWINLNHEGLIKHLLTSKESQLLILASKYNQNNLNPPYLSEKQIEAIWKIKEKVESN